MARDLYTTELERMDDESQFREYIGLSIGMDDSDILAFALWEASGKEVFVGVGREINYLTRLAELSRTIAERGPEIVQQAIAEAKKTEEKTPLSILIEYSSRLMGDVTHRLRNAPLINQKAETKSLWKLTIRRMKKKLREIYPNATDIDINNAVAVGCVWDQEKETFGIEPRVLVEAMRRPSPSKST